MNGTHEDSSVTYFLELDGTVHFVDEKCRYRIEIEAKRTDVTPERPHGLSYSLKLHDSEGERILGFDNAHPVPAGKRYRFHDHKHRINRTRVYEFVDAETLIVDFYRAVDQILREKGALP